MRAFLASLAMAALLTACDASNAATPFSLQGKGYKCTLLTLDDNLDVSDETPIELLWHGDLLDEGHFEFDEDTPETVMMTVDGAVRLFEQTGWSGNIIGSHHTFETKDARYKLTLTDGIHSPEGMVESGMYYLEGSLWIEGSGEVLVHNVKGLCRL